MSGDRPKLEKTDGLVQAIEEADGLRGTLLGFGLDKEAVCEVFATIRRLDAEIVAALHEYRNREMSPYYPDDFQAEEDGYDAAERSLRAPVPKVSELRE